MAKRKSDPQPALVRHDGGLCTHFVNTACAGRAGIGSYAGLLTWGQRAGVLGAADAQRLERSAGDRPADAAAALDRALELRRRLRRILEALARRRRPPVADLDAVASALGAAAAAHRFVPAAGGGYRLDWGDRGGDDLERMLWPVLSSAAEVLSPEEFYRVRQCAGDDCTLLFVDRSPGSPRKWCRHCGNRARSRKHYRTRVKPAREKFKERLEQRIKAIQRESARPTKDEEKPSATASADAKSSRDGIA